jgi:hypothetical protein
LFSSLVAPLIVGLILQLLKGCDHTPAPTSPSPVAVTPANPSRPLHADAANREKARSEPERRATLEAPAPWPRRDGSTRAADPFPSTSANQDGVPRRQGRETEEGR